MDGGITFSADMIDRIVRIILTLAIGLFITYGLAYLVRRTFTRKMTKQSRLVVNRGIVYTGILVMVFIIFRMLEVDITALFGAAGILGIVIGVASQTSLGNIISGLFLVSEKSFEIGDVVRIGDKTGKVFSIDLLSIKIKTFDNLLLRIPNQTVISTELINVTRFPIRRMDIRITVAYKEDLQRVKAVLEEIARQNPLVLDEPEPLVLLHNFGINGIEITYGVWHEKDNFLKVKNSVFVAIKETFDREGIEIPVTQVSVQTGSGRRESVTDRDGDGINDMVTF
jgi:small-conductance mechanosensitive channel